VLAGAERRAFLGVSQLAHGALILSARLILVTCSWRNTWAKSSVRHAKAIMEPQGRARQKL
jgi:hypothetical protein